MVLFYHSKCDMNVWSDEGYIFSGLVRFEQYKRDRNTNGLHDDLVGTSLHFG